MKSQGLKELIQHIFSNDQIKQEFVSNPENVVSRYKLTRQEKRAVLTTHAKQGLVASDSPQLEAAIKASDIWFSPEP